MTERQKWIDMHSVSQAFTRHQPRSQGLHFSQWRAKYIFTITAEILARSLANFYCQLADRHMNLQFMRCINEQERTICYRKK